MSTVEELVEEIATSDSVKIWLSEAFNIPIEDEGDEKDWRPGSDPKINRMQKVEQVRWLTKWQPNAKRALSLYRTYVLGRGFDVTLHPLEPEKELKESDKKHIRNASKVWKEFLNHNRKWWSIREFGERTWRDGESFTIKVKTETDDISELRFVDPEEIDVPSKVTANDKFSDGIVTADNDMTQVEAYLRIDLKTRELIDTIPIDKMFHVKIDSDSTEKRGWSRFLPVIDLARQVKAWLNIEIIMRSLQASIALQRKVKGSGSQLTSHMDNTKTSSTKYPEQTLRREKFRPGSIINTNEGVELEFVQPDTNFDDASELGRFVIKQIGAATGWPYYMISSDSAESNFSSTLVAESPVVFMVEEEQDFFGTEIKEIYSWVINEAIDKRRFKAPSGLWERFEPKCDFPKLVSRDRLKERQADNIGFMAKAISRNEVARRDGADPELMDRETKDDHGKEEFQTAVSSMNQSPDQKQANQGDNQGDGQNQGNTSGPDKRDDTTRG